MARISLVLATVVAVVFGWHLYGVADARRQVEEMRSHRGASAGGDPVEVNPLTNVVTLPVGIERHDKDGKDDGPFEALGNAIGSVLGGAIAQAVAPTIEREINLRAREHYDVYAMLLPYRVRVLAPGTDRR